MAKEIIATFQNGGIFDGVANSYTLNGKTTYYFDIDKRYRVAVTDDGQIVSQQYQNTNGAWYNIDIITKIEIKDISGSGDVTIEYLKENYYTKSESDDRYVNKTGDTMTGDLYFKYNNSTVKVTSNSITLFDGINTDVIKVQLYNGNVFLNGSVYYSDHIVPGSAPDNFFQISINGLNRSSNYTTPFNFNCPTAFNNRVDLLAWMYIRSAVDGSVSGIIQNNANIAMYNGHGFYTSPNTYDNDQYDGVTLSGTRFSGNPLTFTNKVVAQNTIVSYSTITSYSTISVNPSSGNTGNTVISPGNIVVYSSLNNSNAARSVIQGDGLYHRNDNNTTYMWLRYDYQRYVNAGQTKVEVAAGGIDLYHDATTTYHSGAAGETEQYTRMGSKQIIMYNTSYNDMFSINPNTARFEIKNAYSITTNSTGLTSMTAGTDIALRDANGYITPGRVSQTINNCFYGEEFLNALNKVLLFIFNKIGATVYYDFPSQDYGGGFVAGGGSSRGGGVGRR